MRKVKVDVHQVGRTGSVTLAGDRAHLQRNSLCLKRQEDEEFAQCWTKALVLGVDRRRLFLFA